MSDQPDESELVGPLFLGNVNKLRATGISWEVEIPVMHGTIRFKIDKGADVTVIPQDKLPEVNIELNEMKYTHKK